MSLGSNQAPPRFCVGREDCELLESENLSLKEAPEPEPTAWVLASSGGYSKTGSPCGSLRGQLRTMGVFTFLESGLA